MSIRKFALLIAVIGAAVVGTAAAHAQSTRTFVSNTGTNNTQCSVTQPCQTFAQALAATASGGEINCLNPGGFGLVTINISVTINCEGVSNGGITVPSGDAGVTINTSNIVVNLIGLDINGGNQHATGSGVSVTSNATVSIRNCKIYGFLGSGSGAIQVLPSLNAGILVVDNAFISLNNIGIYEQSTGASMSMTVRNSTVSNNGIGIWVTGSGGHAGATIEQDTLAFNQVGLAVQESGAVAVIGSSTVVNNGTGVVPTDGGTLYSIKNNNISGNGTDGTPITAYPGYTGGGA